MKMMRAFAAGLSLFLVTGVLAREPVRTGKGAPVEASDPHAAKPLGNPGDWVTTNDYPEEALREDWQGTVSFVLIIDRGGRVEKCTAVVSSGHELLDVTACNLITQRAIFKPATDQRNRPTSGSYSSRVRWALPTEMPAPRAFSIELTFVLEPDGSISHCRVVKVDGIRESERARIKSPCDLHQTMEPLTDPSGNPVRRLVRSRSSMTIEPVP